MLPHQFDPHVQRALLFELEDARLPGGKAVGKCMPLHLDGDPLNHPQKHELNFLTFFSNVLRPKTSILKSKGDECFSRIEELKNLPEVFAVIHNVPVYAKAFADKLPLAVVSGHTHPYMSVVICKKYIGDLYDLATDKLTRPSMDVKTWKSIIFQIMYTLHALQQSLCFQHNDLHFMNILFDLNNSDKMEEFQVCRKRTKHKKALKRKYILPGIEIKPIMWDFETSVCHSTEKYVPQNLKQNENIGPINCTPDTFTRYYDVHTLLMYILSLKPPQEVCDFIFSLYPVELIPGKEALEMALHPPSAKSSSNASSTQTSATNSSVNSDSSWTDIASEGPTSVNDYKEVMQHLASDLELEHPNEFNKIISVIKEYLDATNAEKEASSEAIDILETENTETDKVSDHQSNNSETADSESISSEEDEDIVYTKDGIPVDWFYDNNAEYADYLLSDISYKDRAKARKERKQEATENQLIESFECGHLVKLKLSKEAAAKFTDLPNPIDVMLHTFFDEYIA
jgi:hypothetical protein